MSDISERKKSEQMLRHLAYHDTLTGLPNSRLFIKQLKNAVNDNSLSGFAVMFMDLDRFKYINDTWGHDAGDLVLMEAARRLKETVAPTDIVSRLGGDEFTILLTSTPDQEAVETIAGKIQESFQLPFDIGGKLYDLSASIGISIFPKDGRGADELLTRADTALYHVKEQVRRGYAFFNQNMEKQSLERILIENELGKAIKREQLDLQYRPKFDFTSGGLAGVELFVRWFHPELGEIKPETFMPLAEETGLIVPLGEWMLKKGCEQYQEWKAKGYSPPTVTIHLTERQLKQKNLAEEIGVILTETGMNPDRLELEMTENTLAGIKQASDILQEIKRWGVQLSINQFGIGNSVISYLHHLPADSVKLDPAFMKNIGLNDKSSAVVKAVVSLAQALGIKVIAENIEHQGKLDFLNGETTEQIQGIVSGKPLGMDEFEYLLKENAFMCL